MRSAEAVTQIDFVAIGATDRRRAARQRDQVKSVIEGISKPLRKVITIVVMKRGTVLQSTSLLESALKQPPVGGRGKAA